MRQKKLKGIDKDLMQDSGVIVNSTRIKFLENKSIFLEIGSGKGKFISSLAKDNKENIYIAFEKNINVCYRILEKKQIDSIDNLIIILGEAEDILEYFDENSISKIYLNFSDPWPKKKHHKRRLTSGTFLDDYIKILNKNGIIQFRTDHKELFEDSILLLNDKFDVIDMNSNLEVSDYMTEYEEKKREDGPIYQVVLKVK